MATTSRRPTIRPRPEPIRHPGASNPTAALPGLECLGGPFGLAFDLMRSQHAAAVQWGFIANSILESRDFERTMDALEHATLGPFARHV